jgi:hypothetical protein
VADKRCENGHFIDESWDLCPYCPADESAEPEIPVVRPSRFTSSQNEPRSGTQAGVRPGTEAEGRRPVAAPAPAPRREVAEHAPPMERTVAVPKAAPGSALDGKRYVVGWLIGLNASARGESFPVRIGRNVLGRDRRSDIIVNDDQASSHHADLVFRPEERRFILMDHNSTNGTYVNEDEIEPRRDLAEKDVVRIGSHKFLFMPLCQEGFYWDEEGALQ